MSQAIGNFSCCVGKRNPSWPARRADLERFLAKVQAMRTTLLRSPDALWFIARAGFRATALRCGRQKDILLSSEQDLQALVERLGVRFAK